MVYNGCIRRSFIKVGTTRGVVCGYCNYDVMITSLFSPELCKPFLKHVEASSLRNAIFIDMVYIHSHLGHYPILKMVDCAFC